jgi:hypothetical protein
VRRTCGTETEAAWPLAESARRGAARSEEHRSGALLWRSATARAAKRWEFQHELATTVGPELVAMASRWPELNPAASLTRIRGRRSTAGGRRASAFFMTSRLVK